MTVVENVVELDSLIGMKIECASLFSNTIDCDSLIGSSMHGLSVEVASIIYLDDVTDWDGEIF